MLHSTCHVCRCSLIFHSVAEDGARAQAQTEEMEISTRSRGKNTLTVIKKDIYIYKCALYLLPSFFPLWKCVCVISGLLLHFQTRGRASGAELRKERCRVRRTRQTATRQLKRPPAKLKRRRSQVHWAAARTR